MRIYQLFWKHVVFHNTRHIFQTNAFYAISKTTSTRPSVLVVVSFLEMAQHILKYPLQLFLRGDCVYVVFNIESCSTYPGPSHKNLTVGTPIPIVCALFTSSDHLGLSWSRCYPIIVLRLRSSPTSLVSFICSSGITMCVSLPDVHKLQIPTRCKVAETNVGNFIEVEQYKHSNICVDGLVQVCSNTKQIK